MNDRTRQVVITLSAGFMVVGTLFGIGVFGTRVEESAGGSLSATATLLAPAGPAFSIWSVIYLGLIGFVVWQWLPSANPVRVRRIGWLAAASMVLNASWLLVTQQGWLWASVAVILALTLVLGELVRRLVQSSASSLVERILMDGTFGLYLGWVAVATVANITAALVASDVRLPGSDTVWAVVVLAVAALIGVGLAQTLRSRIGVALAMTWGLAWIAVGRLTSEPQSTTTGIAAALAAAVVLSAHLLLRMRTRGSLEASNPGRPGAPDEQ